MSLSWLPQTFSSVMVADYVATVFPAGGRAFPLYVIAHPLQNGLFQQAVYTAGYGYTSGEIPGPRFSSANDVPIPGAQSDHPMRTYGELDNERPKPTPPRKK